MTGMILKELAIGVALLIGKAKPPSVSQLHWNYHNSRELGPENALGKTKGFSAFERSALAALIEERLADGSGSALSKTRLNETAMQTSVLATKLGAQPAVIAQGYGEEAGCSPTGNCPLWIFERTPTGYEIILDANSIQTFTIQPTRTNGYLDLVLGRHGSAFEQELHLYKFENGAYQDEACYVASWRRLVGDDYVDLKEPDIAPCEQQ